MECNEQKVDALITEDRRVAVKEIVMQLGIRHSGIEEMMKTLE
jgi:hypothetical protein